MKKIKIKIHKGINQIGGCITEISSKSGSKIIIDFGEDLPDEEKPKIKFELNGLTKGKKKYDAVFITHSHGDHISSINKVLKSIPIYIEEKSFYIYEKTIQYTTYPFKKNFKLDSSNYFKFNFNDVINIGDIKITPYIIDHSSYNSAMFLVECDGKRVLHTGDFRTHGRKQNSLLNAIRKIVKVDYLITEGTSLGREKKELVTEQELSSNVKSLFTKYNQIYILQASTNIDRIVGFYKAKGNKAFIMDAATCDITSNISGTIPSFGEKKYTNLFSYKPIKYVKEKEEIFNEKFSNRQFNFNSKRDFVMLVKSSMIEDIKKIYDKNKKCLFVYSMWPGYIDRQEFMSNFINEIIKLPMDFVIRHTSGHADNETLMMLDKILNYPKVIVIHTNKQEKAKKLFKNYIEINDNKEMEV